MRLPDIVALDRNERPILVADALFPAATPRFVEDRLRGMREARTVFPSESNVGFGMIVDPDSITLYDLNAATDSPLCRLDSADTFTRYVPEYRELRARRSGLTANFLKGIATAWLRDLAYHWKTETPPGSEVLASIGLLTHLEGGFAQRGVAAIELDAVC